MKLILKFLSDAKSTMFHEFSILIMCISLQGDFFICIVPMNCKLVSSIVGAKLRVSKRACPVRRDPRPQDLF